jgi:hypothetical protein
MPATYEAISTTTLGSAASSITFSTIPGTYTDLRLVLVATSASNNTTRIRFNNISTTSYSYTWLVGTGSAASSGRSTGNSQIDEGDSSFFNTTPYLDIVDIFSYTGSTNKTILRQISSDRNGAGTVESQVALFRDTTAITRIDLIGSNTNFAIGTTATLYGILKA